MIDSGMQQYVDEVMRFRKALNLTAIRDPDMFIEKFIDPTLALADFLPDRGRLLDIGSGMGVPGIPLLIAKPALHGILVERRRKRAEFLRHICRRLSIEAQIFDADINALDVLDVDVCVARAVADESMLLRMCAKHVVIGGCAVLPVASSRPPAQVDGWMLEREQQVSIGDDGVVQLVRCYRYG